MQIKQIIFQNENINNEYVFYEKAIKPKMDFESDELKNVFEDIREELFLQINELLEEYLDDEELCNDDEGFFPQPRYMTGEWYLARIYMEPDYLSIETHFIGTDTGKKDDYLGLEVSFYYDEDKKEWLFDGINSEAL